MTTPTHLINNLYAVEVPEGAKDIHCETSMTGTPYVAYKFKDDELLNEYEDIVLPPGNWQLICTSKECSGERAESIVERVDGGFKDYDEDNFHNDIPYPEPIDSLHSLLKSKGLSPKYNYAILKKEA